MKVTVPVGEPLVALTVAVKVTDCPKTAGFCEEAKVVVVPCLLTVWVSVAEVFVRKLPSPL